MWWMCKITGVGATLLPHTHTAPTQLSLPLAPRLPPHTRCQLLGGPVSYRGVKNTKDDFNPSLWSRYLLYICQTSGLWLWRMYSPQVPSYCVTFNLVFVMVFVHVCVCRWRRWHTGGTSGNRLVAYFRHHILTTDRHRGIMSKACITYSDKAVGYGQSHSCFGLHDHCVHSEEYLSYKADIATRPPNTLISCARPACCLRWFTFRSGPI